jgi:phage terminase large subunit-like protein
MSQVGWRVITMLARQVPGAVIRQSERMVTLPGGGSVQVKSADNPDSLRGEGLDFLGMDECAYTHEDAWTAALRPALSDRLGKAMFISTPSRRNWFFRIWQRGIDDDPEWKSFRFPTSDNPFIQPTEIEAARGMLPDRLFRQEYLAEFIEDEGAVFRNIAACITSSIPERAAHVGHRLVMGADWGKHNDYTALSVGCADCKVELARDRFNQIDYAVQRARLGALAESWAVTNILAESNAMGEPIIEQLQRDGLPVRGFVTSATSKPPRCGLLSWKPTSARSRRPPGAAPTPRPRACTTIRSWLGR